jgi:hypothetical protein
MLPAVGAEDDRDYQGLLDRAKEAHRTAVELRARLRERDLATMTRTVRDESVRLRSEATALREGRAQAGNLVAELQALVAQLETALSTRAPIEQAKGILMGAERCSADQAFDMLRRASQRENRKLRDVAQDLVDRVGHPAE